MALPDFSQMTEEQIRAFMSGQYGNIGTPTLNSDNRYGGEGQGTGFYSGGGLDFLTQTPDGFTGPIGAPYDQPGQGGVFGQQFGAFDTMGNMTGSEFAQQQRPSFFDKNGWLAPLLPVGAAGVNALLSGGLGTAPATTAGVESAAVSGGNAASSGINSALANSGTASVPSLTNSTILPSLGEGAASNFGNLTGSSLLTGGGLAPGLSAEALAAAGTGGASLTPSLLDGLLSARNLTGLAGTVAGIAGSNPGPSVQTTSVPDWLQPLGQNLTGKAEQILNSPFQPYTGQRFVGPNDAQQRSWEMISQMAGGPTAQQTQAQGVFENLTKAEIPEFGNAQRVNNQYIGQGVAPAQNQYIGQNTPSNVLDLAQSFSNPSFGQTSGQIGPIGQMSIGQSTTGVGKNALLGLDNPYLNDAIKYAQGDVTRNFDQSIAPRLAAQARASGSFGNSGVQQQEQEAYRNLASELGRVSSGMRMQDYGLQAQLGEGDLSRQLQGGLADAARNTGSEIAQQQFNLGTDYNRQVANANLRSGDLARDSAASVAQNNNLLQGGMFDTKVRAEDLSRNANLTDILARTNATLAQNDLTRNTGAQTRQLEFNAQQGNIDTSNAMANWNSSNNRALQAAQMYPTFDDSAYRRASSLGTTGAQMAAIAQQPLNFTYEEFLRQQNDPLSKAAAAGGLYGNIRGGNSVTSTTNSPNTLASGLGGGLSSLGFYDLMTRGY